MIENGSNQPTDRPEQRNKHYDTSSTRLACYSNAGFTDQLREVAAAEGVDLTGLGEIDGR